MSSSPEAADRKVRQLDNDVRALYELLAAIQGTQLRQGNRLDELGGSIAEVKSEVGSIRTEVGSVKTDVGSVKTDVGSVKTEIGSVRSELGELSIKVDRILGHLER